MLNGDKSPCAVPHMQAVLNRKIDKIANPDRLSMNLTILQHNVKLQSKDAQEKGFTPLWNCILQQVNKQ